MNKMTSTNAPWHLWLTGLLALLFTAFGCYDYVMSQLGDRAYIAGAVEPFGIDTDVAVEYFANFPVWADFVWATGVWGGLAGSILLLLRSRFALPAYLASLAGMLVSNAYSFANPIPGLTDNGVAYVAVAIVFVVMAALTLYTWSMARRGVLS